MAADGSGCGAGADGAGSQELRIGAGLEQARRLLGRLSGRDLSVLLGRALNPAPKPARTLEDLGQEFGGLAKERVRQIEVLTAEGHPLTLIAISASIPEPHAIKSLHNFLVSDRRFRRVSQKNWGLSAWGGEPYPGTFPAMVAELERRGGTAGIDELAAVLADRFEINRNSVDMYAWTSPA